MAGYRLEITKEAQEAFQKISKKNKSLLSRAESQIIKILNYPEIGKPLRHSMKNQRRLHVGSFVLVYEIESETIRILDFDHHNNIYKKKKWIPKKGDDVL